MKSAYPIETMFDETEHRETTAVMDSPTQMVTISSDRREEAKGRGREALPSGYFYSIRFIGSYCVRAIYSNR